MPMDQNLIESYAKTLRSAQSSGDPCRPLTDLHPEVSTEDAYKISQHNAQIRLSLPKEKLVGKKVGLTSFAVQKQLGVKEPDFGYLFGSMMLENNGVLPTKSLIQGKAEGEVAFTLKSDLVSATKITEEDVLSATDYIQPCIEIIDSRIADWKIKIQDTVSDNASSAYFVLGPKKSNLDEVYSQLPEFEMKLTVNGQVASKGKGAACMDSPLKAVAWLANKMISLGEPLKAREIILSGAFGPVVPITSGDQCSVTIEHLGSVAFSIMS